MRQRLPCMLLLPLLLMSAVRADGPAASVERAFVLGEVRTPGAVTLTDSGMTVYDVVACCGGPTKAADASNVRLIHHLPDRRQTVVLVNLNRFMVASEATAASSPKATDPSLDPVVQPGDVIFVSQATTTQTQ